MVIDERSHSATFYCLRCGIRCCYSIDNWWVAFKVHDSGLCHACAKEMDNALIEDYIKTGEMKQSVPLPFVEKPKGENII